MCIRDRYCDIRHPSELNSVCEYTREKYGRIDIAINCAGITDDAEIEEMTADQWEKVISINLTGTMNFLKVASSYMKCSGGKVFVLSSSQGKAARTRQANYVASKAGVSQMCIVAAKELAKYNIHVNVTVSYTHLQTTQAAVSKKIGSLRLGLS